MKLSIDPQVLQRIRAEFVEMPGMVLRLEQVRRLCGVDASVCQGVLDALVAARFLRVSADGHYTRLTDGGAGLMAGDAGRLRAPIGARRAI